MTVEFAVALPVVAIVLTALVAAVLVVDAQGRLQLAAATAARAIGRDDEHQGRSAADRIAPGVSVVVRSDGDLVCVDDDHLLKVLSEQVRVLPGVRDTETFVYLKTTKENYAWGTR